MIYAAGKIDIFKKIFFSLRSMQCVDLVKMLLSSYSLKIYAHMIQKGDARACNHSQILH